VLEDKNNTITVPEYFNNITYINELLGNVKKDELKNLLENIEKWPITRDFRYKFTHPITNKVLFGPDKVNVDEHFKIHFITPLCFIIEIYTYCSGYMLMDTFYNVKQFKYESNFIIQENKLKCKTNLTVSYGVTFVKVNPFKGTVESQGLKDNEKSVKEELFPHLIKVLQSKTSNLHKNGEDKRGFRINTFDFVIENKNSNNNNLKFNLPIDKIINLFGKEVILLIFLLFILSILIRNYFPNIVLVGCFLVLLLIMKRLDKLERKLGKLKGKPGNK